MQRQPRFNTYRAAACAVLLSLCFALPANAATFSFSWSADPFLDSTIVSADDPAATATGFLDINVPNGAAFTESDITNFNVSVKGDAFDDFVAKTPYVFRGTVAADGATASIYDIIATEIVGGFGDGFFYEEGLIEDSVGILVGPTGNRTLLETRYDDPAAAKASLKLTAAPPRTTTFDFFWSADPLLDSTIVSADDPAATATGTLVINAPYGASFREEDVTSFNISVKGDTFDDFLATTPFIIRGSIAADGSTASIFEIIATELAGGFGNALWHDKNAFETSVVIVLGPVGNHTLLHTLYDDLAATRASLELTAAQSSVVVPVPAALPLLGTGLTLLALLGWRRKRVTS